MFIRLSFYESNERLRRFLYHLQWKHSVALESSRGERAKRFLIRVLDDTRDRPANDAHQYDSLHGSLPGLFLSDELHFELNHSRAAPRLPSPRRVGGPNEWLFTLP